MSWLKLTFEYSHESYPPYGNHGTPPKREAALQNWLPVSTVSVTTGKLEKYIRRSTNDYHAIKTPHQKSVRSIRPLRDQLILQIQHIEVGGIQKASPLYHRTLYSDRTYSYTGDIIDRHFSRSVCAWFSLFRWIQS